MYTMTSNLEDQVQHIVAGMNEREQQEPEIPIEIPQPDEIQDIYVLIVREQEEAPEHTQVVDSTPVTPQKISFLPAYAICGLYFICILATLAFQLSCIVNPPIATVTIIPKSQQVSLTGTLQLGRALNPLTISQSQTVPATGKGHQPAEQARGSITFYNGQLHSVTIAAGTILTGSDGIRVVTDQDAYVPPESQTIPPTLGHSTVSAHAGSPGVKGNIPIGDINQGCCAPSVLAQNTAPFSKGQDERDFSTVSTQDINSLSTLLKTSLVQSINGAFQGQLKPQEQLFILPCAPTVTSDHQPGQEAMQVKVTVSQTCSAVAYNSQEVAEQATVFLSTQALHNVGAGYSMFGTVKVSITQATIQKQVLVSFSASGTWVYGLSQTAQQHIKHLIAGKTTQNALQLIASLPGVERAAIRFTGFGDAARLPKDTSYIHIRIFVV